jgi:hypothetical protein
MTGSMQAATSFEHEAVRRQEVLLAEAGSGVSGSAAFADAARSTRRVVGRLAAGAAAVVALLATGGSAATDLPRP